MSVTEANAEVVKRFQEAEPYLVDAGKARDVVPGMRDKLITHAGPPISWDRMCGPMRGAVLGAILYEGWAKDIDSAKKAASSGEISYEPNHHHKTVGPMAGVTSPSMPVFIIENRRHGNRSFCNMNEGFGKCLRFGAYSSEVIDRLKWMEGELFPIIKDALLRSGGIDWRSLIVQALQMGDDCHNRNKAATALFAKQAGTFLSQVSLEKETISRVFKFIDGNDHFAINITMAACKAIADAGHDVEGSSVLTAMCRNGVDFGIRVSGLGDRWFTAPCNTPVGLYFPGFSATDANPDIGDSTITETVGIGGFAMAGAPSIVQFVGGTYKDALRFTQEMYEITVTENRNFKIPTLDFRGTPTGIDLIKVLETGIPPRINTGMAHKEPGIGQVGAGIVTAPMECFEKAAQALLEKQDARQ